MLTSTLGADVTCENQTNVQDSSEKINFGKHHGDKCPVIVRNKCLLNIVNT